MFLAENDEVIEAFLTQRLSEAFRVRIQIGYQWTELGCRMFRAELLKRVNPQPAAFGSGDSQLAPFFARFARFLSLTANLSGSNPVRIEPN